MKWNLIAVGLLASALLIHFSSDYMQSKPMTLTVLGKYLPAAGYKSSASPVMVLQTTDGRIFDEYVSFSTYHQFAAGDRVVMELRRFDIRPTAWENAIFFFGVTLLFGIGAAILAVRLACRALRLTS